MNLLLFFSDKVFPLFKWTEPCVTPSAVNWERFHQAMPVWIPKFKESAHEHQSSYEFFPLIAMKYAQALFKNLNVLEAKTTQPK